MEWRAHTHALTHTRARARAHTHTHTHQVERLRLESEELRSDRDALLEERARLMALLDDRTLVDQLARRA